MMTLNIRKAIGRSQFISTTIKRPAPLFTFLRTSLPEVLFPVIRLG